MMQSILFVCTGNVFRSVAAEYAVRAQSGPQSCYQIQSAGIKASPQSVPLIVRHPLIQKGIDPVTHIPQALTKELIDRVDLIIAMSLNHREFIQRQFGLTVPLFNEVSCGEETPILDLHEALPDWGADLIQARNYVESVIDHIWISVPAFMARLSQFPGHRRPLNL